MDFSHEPQNFSSERDVGKCDSLTVTKMWVKELKPLFRSDQRLLTEWRSLN
ncbi:hypothetical protein [uncultured Nostoc sp.]|uniref:hypothetical protein n=1 Tax=uncultured Nostoc sp. TaxID=340711 RepID=UPI0035CB6A94